MRVRVFQLHKDRDTATRLLCFCDVLRSDLLPGFALPVERLFRRFLLVYRAIPSVNSVRRRYRSTRQRVTELDQSCGSKPARKWPLAGAVWSSPEPINIGPVPISPFPRAAPRKKHRSIVAETGGWWMRADVNRWPAFGNLETSRITIFDGSFFVTKAAESAGPRRKKRPSLRTGLLQ